MSARAPLVAAVTALALAGCHTTTTTTDNTLVTDLGTNDAIIADGGPGASEGEGDTETSTAPGDWTLSERDDPMTDHQVLVLNTSVAGRVNDVQLEVSCDPSARSFRYTIAGYDKRQQGAPLSTDYANGGRHPYTIRGDAERPSARTGNSRFSNQIDVTDAYEAMVRPTRLVLQVPFANSDETYFIDQSGPTFRNAIARCRAVIDAADQAQRDQQAAAVRQQQEQDAAPVTVDQQTGPGWQGPPTAEDSEPSGWNSITTR